MGFPSSNKIQFPYNLLYHFSYKREVVIAININISFSLNCTMEAKLNLTIYYKNYMSNPLLTAVFSLQISNRLHIFNSNWFVMRSDLAALLCLTIEH